MGNWKHFKIELFSASNTAKRLGIDNTPKGEYYNNMDELVTTILDPLYEAWGSSITVSSGYRCDALNNAVGGSKTSAHSLAYAADLVPGNGKIEEFKAFVMKWLYENNIMFDLYINEYKGKSSWVHIGVRNRSKLQRKQYMLFKDNKYTLINPLTFKGGVDVTITPTLTSTTTDTPSNSYNTDTPATTVVVTTSNINDNFTSTTSNIGNGTLTGKLVYMNERNVVAIQANDVYIKSDSGEPELDDKTGEVATTDNYLIGTDEHLIDEIEDINEIPKEPDENLLNLLNALVSDNIEHVKGISYNADGSYALKNSKTLQELMLLVWLWWELVQTLKISFKNIENNVVDSTTDDNGITTINAHVFIQSAFDKFGHAISEGLTCPVCGKKVKYLGAGGYCSTECMLQDAKNKAISFLMKPNDKYKDFNDTINLLCKILDLTTLIINAITGIPDIVKDLTVFPEKYKQYVICKITEGFCELQILINLLMIKKNELIKKLLKPIKMGWITKPIAGIFIAIEAIQNALKEALNAFDLAYETVMNALEPLKYVSGLAIDAESFAWCATPRSYISPLPYTSPDAGKIFVNLPGGSGMQKLSLVKPLMPSGMSTINFAELDTIILECFPPLTPVDYYLEPELFDVRYLFSDLSDLVKLIRLQLEDYLSGGPDYMPKFENLLPVKKFTNAHILGETIPELWLPNVGYIWFLLGLSDAWAPHSQALVGSMINPAI